MSSPLSDARTASIGKHHTTHFVKGVQKSITSHSETNLLGTWGDGVLRLGYQFFIYSLLRKRSCSRNILIGRVGTRTDQSDVQLRWPSIFSDSSSEFRDRPCQIWSEWTIYMRLKFRKVDFNYLIEILLWVSVYFSVTGQMLSDAICQCRNIGTACSRKVGGRFFIVAKNGGSCSNLSTHVTDSSFTCSR